MSKLLSLQEHETLINDVNNIKDWTKSKIDEILNRYNIDINYYDGLILTLIVQNMASPVMKDYQNVNLFLQMGANPNLIMGEESIIFNIDMKGKLCLDAIFQSFGYKCLWINYDPHKYLNFDNITIENDENSESDDENEENSESDDENENNNKENKDESNKTRYFRMIDNDNGIKGDRYCGFIPEDAAKKAFTKICRVLKEKNIELADETKVILEETTRGCKHEKFEFMAQKVRLDIPQKLVIADQNGNKKIIEYYYENQVRRL